MGQRKYVAGPWRDRKYLVVMWETPWVYHSAALRVWIIAQDMAFTALRKHIV